MIRFKLPEYDDMEIISLQLNIMFNNIEAVDQTGDLNNITQDLFTIKWEKCLEEYMRHNIKKYYVIDMMGIGGAQKVFEELCKSEVKRIIFINCNDCISGYIQGGYREKITKISEGCFGTKEAKDHIKDVPWFIGVVENYYKRECVRRLVKFGIRNDTTLNHSSNVYTNMYVDIRKLFTEKNNMAVFIFNLYQIVKELDAFDSFIVVSNNGAVLANILSYIFEKKVLYLMNLGPKIALKDREIQRKIKKGFKYIYVYDFMCLGNELKMIDTLLKIHGATLEYSVGIAQLLSSDRYKDDKTVRSVIQLCDHPEDFPYEMTYYKKESE